VLDLHLFLTGNGTRSEDVHSEPNFTISEEDKMTPINQSTLAEDSVANSDQPIALASSEEQIRRRAYELYEERGRQDGFAEQDWLRAESELTSDQTLKAAA